MQIAGSSSFSHLFTLSACVHSVEREREREGERTRKGDGEKGQLDELMRYERIAALLSIASRDVHDKKGSQSHKCMCMYAYV